MAEKKAESYRDYLPDGTYWTVRKRRGHLLGAAANERIAGTVRGLGRLLQSGGCGERGRSTGVRSGS